MMLRQIKISELPNKEVNMYFNYRIYNMLCIGP